jgi:hypothetical protein
MNPTPVSGTSHSLFLGIRTTLSGGAGRRNRDATLVFSGHAVLSASGACRRYVVAVPLSFGVTVLPDPPYQRLIELLQLAERHGFEYGWTYS